MNVLEQVNRREDEVVNELKEFLQQPRNQAALGLVTELIGNAKLRLQLGHWKTPLVKQAEERGAIEALEKIQNALTGYIEKAREKSNARAVD